MKRALLAGLTAALVAVTLPSLVRAQALDPQSLVGEWAGTWSVLSAEQANVSGPYSLTVRKVEGAKVFARLFVWTPRAGNIDRDVVLTLDDSRLTMGTTEFAVEGKEMNGMNRGGTIPSQISLRKK